MATKPSLAFIKVMTRDSVVLMPIQRLPELNVCNTYHLQLKSRATFFIFKVQTVSTTKRVKSLSACGKTDSN